MDYLIQQKGTIARSILYIAPKMFYETEISVIGVGIIMILWDTYWKFNLRY